MLQPVVTDQPRGKCLREGGGRKIGMREAEMETERAAERAALRGSRW